MERLRILYAVETLLPPRGGAELFAIELFERLADRHHVTALSLDRAGQWTGPAGVELCAIPPPPDGPGYWSTKRRRREAVAEGVAALLRERDVDVVASTLHAAPGATAAATAAGVPVTLFLHSYEPFCKYAFDAGSRCVPGSGCRSCPAASALPPSERSELLASRQAHRRAVEHAAEVIATSATVARACEDWAGRRPVVAHAIPPEVPPARARRDGHVLLAAAEWSPNKGGELLEPLAEALAPHRLAITVDGLERSLARRLRRHRHVRLVPNAPLAELLEGAAAVLVPSQWPEPFGRLAYEGLAAGVPTLAAAVGGLREFVPPEQLVDRPADPMRWRESLDAVLEDWEAARTRGRVATDAIQADDPLGRIEATLARAAGSLIPSKRRGEACV